MTLGFRGAAAGLLVAALAVAAHGVAGGGVPGSAELGLLGLTGLAVGAPMRGRVARSPLGAAAVLLGGQWAGHLALSGVLGHHRGGAVLSELGHLPSAGMTAAHLLAALAGACLIAGAERLYLLVTGAARAAVTTPGPPVSSRRPNETRYTPSVSAFRPDGAHPPRAPPVPA